MPIISGRSYRFGKNSAIGINLDRILVILSEVNPTIRDTVYDIAWEIGFKYDVFLSPVLAGKSEFATLAASPFYSGIKQYGVPI